jgi:hypothetical protein
MGLDLSPPHGKHHPLPPNVTYDTLNTGHQKGNKYDVHSSPLQKRGGDQVEMSKML